jgi:hypothetical protein
MADQTRAIRTPEEFQALDALYQMSFGEASVPTATLRAWHEAYPQGLIGLFEGSQLVGGISVWALRESAYAQFSQGGIKERALSAADLAPEGGSFFYLSEIAVYPGRGSRARLLALLDAMMAHLSLYGRFPLQVLGLAYSNEGMRIMQRLGFMPWLSAEETADGLPMLRWEAPLATAFQGLLGKRGR